MVFSEDSRVKIPCILHLVRLGYRYLSLKNAVWDEETNFFPELFRTATARINSGMDSGDLDRLLADVKLLLDNEDLGKAFYEKLTERSGIRLIDFVDFSNNSFHVVTELTCKNGDDEFRPDITLLINAWAIGRSDFVCKSTSAVAGNGAAFFTTYRGFYLKLYPPSVLQQPAPVLIGPNSE